MIKGTLYVLRAHLPSAVAMEYLAKVRIGYDELSIAVHKICTNQELKRTKKKVKYKDLPALKMEGDSKIYYKREMTDHLLKLVEEIREKRSKKGRNQAIELQRSDRLHRMRARFDANRRKLEREQADEGESEVGPLPDVRGESQEDN